MQEFLTNSIFNFCLHNEPVNIPAEKEIRFGQYIIYSDKRTSITSGSFEDRELVLFGYAVDVRSGESENLVESILKRTCCLQDILDAEKFLGGKYLLFYREGGNYYAIPDATASIPFCYFVGKGNQVCASVSNYIAKHLNLKVDTVFQRIRNNSDISQAMPFDITIYKEIRQLLPNHYYSFEEHQAVRFVNSEKNQEEISPDTAAQITRSYIENLVKYYAKRFQLYCPITSGRDSRVVLAFLRKEVREPSLRCYTIKHAEHTEWEQDLVIPKELAAKVGLLYQQITDIPTSEELTKKMDNIFGENQYSKRTLMIANTILNYYGDGAIINGDIIGQVGKCSLHKDIPQFLATAGYFRCKLHNYSKESKDILRKWLDEIQLSAEKVSSFDLFSIENRMGRWAAQENIIYNTIGQVYLNVFNSRSIIYEWTRVNRRQRKKSAVHIALIKQIEERLLDVPFEKSANAFITLATSNGIFYYIASRIKHFVKGLRFH